MHQRNCADLSVFNRHSRMSFGRTALTLGGGNVSELKHCFWVLSQEPLEMSCLCLVKWQPALWNHRHTGASRHCTTPALFPCTQRYPQGCLHHIHCVGGVAKLLSLNTPTKWVRKMNIPTEDLNNTSHPAVIFRSDRWKNSNSLSEWLSRVRYKCFMKGKGRPTQIFQMAEDIGSSGWGGWQDSSNFLGKWWH